MVRSAKVRAAGVLLGIGLGGFLDGIVLQQILQWHQMLSALVPPETMHAVKRNMSADGWFHLATWVVSLAGVFALLSAVRGPGPLPSARGLAGYMLIGWGAFNLAEGIIDHHLLELHHVRDLPTHVAFYDWAFLILSAALVLLGLAMRDGARTPAADRRTGRDRRLAY